MWRNPLRDHAVIMQGPGWLRRFAGGVLSCWWVIFLFLCRFFAGARKKEQVDKSHRHQ